MGASAVASVTYTILPRDFRGIVRSGGRLCAFHQAMHKHVSLRYPYQAKYAASGSDALTDGILGGESYDADWQGFERDDLDAQL
jgi:hypothetical protein